MIRMVYLLAILVTMVMLQLGACNSKIAKMNEDLNELKVELTERLEKCEYNCEK